MSDPNPASPAPRPAPAWRLFVAATPDASELAGLARLQARLRPMLSDRWRPIATDDLHLTLRFLGRTPTARVDAIRAALDRVAAEHRGGTLAARRIAAWPARLSRVLVIEYAATDWLDALAAALEQSMQSLGFDAETRRFRPHLTLARARVPQPLRLPADVDPSDASAASLRTLQLFRSDTLPEGARYTLLHEAALCRAPVDRDG